MIKIYGINQCHNTEDIKQINVICCNCKSYDLYCSENSNIKDGYIKCFKLYNELTK
jgi:hypothetical protein